MCRVKDPDNIISADYKHLTFKKEKSINSLEPLKWEDGLSLPRDWNSDRVLRNIFKHMEFEDLVDLNTVCRHWYYLINPIIYKSIKFIQDSEVTNQFSQEEEDWASKSELVVRNCIETLSKYRELINNFQLNIKLSTIAAKEYFTTFCNITILEIDQLLITEEVLLVCLKPLKNLTSLKLSCVRIESTNAHQTELENVQLPDSLTNIEIIDVSLFQVSKVIKSTLTRHSNLEEFVFITCEEDDLINPFINHYPTLKKLKILEFEDYSIQHKLSSIIESNPQLVELTYKSNFINPNLFRLININLANLKVLHLQEYSLRLGQNLYHVEWPNYMNLTSLTLYSTRIPVQSYSSILSKAPHLKQLHLYINHHYHQWTSIIRQKYHSLTDLTFFSHPHIVEEEEVNLMKQFFTNEFDKCYYSPSNALVRLNLGHFNIYHLTPAHLETFRSLEIVRFIHNKSSWIAGDTIKSIENYLKQFRGWEFKLANGPYNCQGYLYKPSIPPPTDLLYNIFFY